MNQPHFCLEHWYPGYEGLYSVDIEGNVYSYVRGSRHKMTPCYDRQGYLKVNLKAGGGKEQARVHRMVMRAFYGEPQPGQLELVLHYNDIKDDNTLFNLRYGSYGENNLDTIRNGNFKPGTGRPKKK